MRDVWFYKVLLKILEQAYNRGTIFVRVEVRLIRISIHQKADYELTNF